MTGSDGESVREGPVVVVGGGVGGLVAAWELDRAGRRPLLLEAGPAVGGCVARHTVGGLELDSGAESFATAVPDVLVLLADLGMAEAVVTPNPVGAWVRHTAGTAPLPGASLLGIPSRPLAADVRRVLGVAGSARAAVDLVLPAAVGAAGGNSLGALVSRRMGRSVVDRLVEPIAGGVYSTDPHRLDVDAVQPRLRSALRETGSLSGAVRRLRTSAAKPGSAVGGVAGGMFTVVDELRRQLTAMGGTISCGARVQSIRQTASGWQLHIAAGDIAAGAVVLAVPGPAAATLLTGIGIDLPRASTTTSDVALVTLVVEEPALAAHPRGTGVLVSASAPGVRAKALTHATAKWAWLARRAGAGHHVLRLSYGRSDGQASGMPPGVDAPGGLGGDKAAGVDISGGLVAATDTAIADAAVLLGIPLRRESVVDSAITP